MKLLIMCEGANEKRIIDLLLYNGLLSFGMDDLLGVTTFQARQITKSAQVRTELNIYPGKVKVLRIGDRQKDRLVIPKDYKEKIFSVEKYCTLPELEILLIISEGKYVEYEKVKSKVRPKEYAKANIKFNKQLYNNSTKFYEDYYGSNINLLVDSIKEYSRLKGKTHAKDERCLADLLK